MKGVFTYAMYQSTVEWLSFGGLFFVVFGILRARRIALENRISAEPRCAQCGYPVVGLPSPVCPECGGNLPDVGILPAGKLARNPMRIVILTVATFICAMSGQWFPWFEYSWGSSDLAVAYPAKCQVLIEIRGSGWTTEAKLYAQDVEVSASEGPARWRGTWNSTANEWTLIRNGGATSYRAAPITSTDISDLCRNFTLSPKAVDEIAELLNASSRTRILDKSWAMGVNAEYERDCATASVHDRAGYGLWVILCISLWGLLLPVVFQQSGPISGNASVMKGDDALQFLQVLTGKM